MHDPVMTTGDAHASPGRNGGPVPHWEVAIVGAGAGGLGLAIRLAKSRRRDFVLFEASDGVGGTWRSNTYPGAACDVPSHLYSYSFARKADWSKTYANQPEILAYFEACAERFGIVRHVRANTRITSARWNEERRRWQLADANGCAYRVGHPGQRRRHVRHALVARHRRSRFLRRALVPFGPLGAPARSDRSTGGGHRDRCQLGPNRARARQGVRGRVSSIQRTPQWILPRSDKPFTEEEKRRFARNPLAARRHRRELYWAFENTIAFRHGERRGRAVEGGCTRVTSTTAFRTRSCGPSSPRISVRLQAVPGLQRLLQGLVARQRGTRDRGASTGSRRVSILTTDGCERPVDAIVLATGFKATDYLDGIDVSGVGGRRLHDDWSDVAHAYLGLTVSGYPNFFMLYGPNTNQGGNSIIVILEAQATYVLGALRAMRRHRVRRRGRPARRHGRLQPRAPGGARTAPSGVTGARATSRTPTGRSPRNSPRPPGGTPRRPGASE